MQKLKRNNITIILLMYGLSFFFILESKEFPEKSANFPQVIAWILIGLTTLLLIQELMGKISPGNKEEKTVPAKYYKAAILSILYVVMVNVTGYILTTPLYLFLLIIALGYNNKKKAALISLIVVAIIYAGFKLALNVPIPEGILFSG